MTTPNNDRPTPDTPTVEQIAFEAFKWKCDGQTFEGLCRVVRMEVAVALERRIAEATEEAAQWKACAIKDRDENVDLRDELAATETALAKTMEALQKLSEFYHDEAYPLVTIGNQSIELQAWVEYCERTEYEVQAIAKAALSLTPEHVADRLAAVEAELEAERVKYASACANLEATQPIIDSWREKAEQFAAERDQLRAELAEANKWRSAAFTRYPTYASIIEASFRAALRAEGGGK